MKETLTRLNLVTNRATRSYKKIILSFFFTTMLLPSCHVGRFFIYNFADINDYKKFPVRTLNHAAIPFHFETTATKPILPATLDYKAKNYNFNEGLAKNGTVAFILIRNDSILYEWYDKNHPAESVVTSFSMTKSFVSILIGIAIDEGHIKSTSEPVTNYLDYLDKDKFGNITIQHVLDMRSGIKFSEGYFNPFSDVAKYYYGRNLKKYVKHMKIKRPPGQEFEYISLNTQLLGLILEKATGKTLTGYMQEKLWSPLGMEYDASWSMDSKKHHTEKAFSGINGCARDFAKFGRLYLNNGTWQGNRIVSEKWVRESLDFTEFKNDFEYSNQWWHTIRWNRVQDSVAVPKLHGIFTEKHKGKSQDYCIYPSGDFYANGLLGQFVYVSPDKKIICVRLGRKFGRVDWPYFLRELAEKN